MKLTKHLLTASVIVGYAILFASSASKPTTTYKPPKEETFDAAPGTTGNASALTRVTSDPVPEFYPSLSSDGKKMVFHIRDDRKTGNEMWSIMMINLGSPGRIPLVGAYTSRPTFFPDNKTIIYSYLKPSKQIIVKSSVDGAGGISYVSPNAMGDYDAGAVIKPNGKQVAFYTGFAGTNQICVMDLNGMNQTILTEGFDPCWSPDGTKLAYTKYVGKFNQIFMYDFGTGQSTQLTSGEFNSSSPKFSANGKYLCFSSDRDNQNEHIFVMKSDGSDLAQLTQGFSRNGMPVFGPDNTIYFCSNAGTKGVRNQWNSSDIWSLKPTLQ